MWLMMLYWRLWCKLALGAVYDWASLGHAVCCKHLFFILFQEHVHIQLY